MQLLEEENTRLESEMKDILKELNHQKDHNDLMRDEVARLETNLKNSKVWKFWKRDACCFLAIY